MSRSAVLHVDESCLGNGREGENPGGGAGLIEFRSWGGAIQRRDFYLHDPATTNNRMALEGAIRALEILSRKGARLRVLMVSDSQYLVKGAREWMRAWAARGSRLKLSSCDSRWLRSAAKPGRCEDEAWRKSRT